MLFRRRWRSLLFLSLLTLLVILHTRSRGNRRQCSSLDFSCKVDAGFRAFERVKQAQSKTVQDALKEYKRRYGRDPPNGMQAWFEMALTNDMQFIDEFGQLEADLAAFRTMSAQELHDNIDAALLANARVTEERRLGVLQIKDGQVSVSGYSFVEIANGTMVEMISPIAHRLPDLRILVNWFAQPRVLDLEKASKGKVDFVDRSGQENWDLLRSPCPANHLTTSPIAQDRPSLDVCQFKQKEHHGIFVAPTTFYPTFSKVPIISRGKLSTMLDILAPNPCYWADRYRMWSEPDSLPFDKKSWSIYWRGQTTGVVLDEKTLFTSHRMRFVNLINFVSHWFDVRKEESGATALFTKAEKLRKAAGLQPDFEALLSIERLSLQNFDVGFDRIFNVRTEEFAETVLNTYPFLRREAPTAMYQHQFLPDIDGEGSSCRFYAQLASSSVPIKQTLFAEAHDDRIAPWVHYIPLSFDLDEVPALLQWLTTSQGLRSAERIATAGREWSSKALRKIDLTMYFYRVLLEYAAITSM